MNKRTWTYSILGASAVAFWVAAPSPSTSSQRVNAKKALNPMALPPPLRVSGQTIPGEIQRPPLELASRDPFLALAPPPVKVVAPPPMKAAPPPPPTPPALNLRFSGRMTNPDGSQTVFVDLGNSPVTLVVGQTLSNGYKVTAITEKAVELSYAPMNFTTRFDLPAIPKYEIR